MDRVAPQENTGGEGSVTAVIPTFNRRPFLEAAIRSALQQTLPGVEVVIVDDGSTDDTAEYLRELVSVEPRVRYLRTDGAGPCVARNAGLKAASTPWVAFLDDDDLWLPEALERLVEFAEARRAEVVACRGLRFFSEDPALSPEDVRKKGDELGLGPWPPDVGLDRVTVGDLLLRPVAPLHAVLFSRAVLDDLGGFDPGIGFAEDYHLLLRAAALQPIPLLASALVLYRWHGGQRWADLERRARGTRLALERFLQSHPRAWLETGATVLRRRLARLAHEEAYAALLDGEGLEARTAALRSLRYWPFQAKSALYWILAFRPGMYRALRRSGRHG